MKIAKGAIKPSKQRKKREDVSKKHEKHAENVRTHERHHDTAFEKADRRERRL